MADSVRSLERPAGGRRRDRGKEAQDAQFRADKVCPKCRVKIDRNFPRHESTCKGPWR